MSVTRKLGRDILIYAIGNLAQRAVVFLLLPLYTNALDVSNFGLLETVTVTSQILIFIMDVGMSRSVLRYYARFKNHPEKLGLMVSTALLMMTTAGTMLLLVGIAAQLPLTRLIFGDGFYTTVLMWTLIASFFQVFNQWIYMIFRARQQSSRYVIVSIVNLIALSGLNILFVSSLDLGVLGVLYAQTIVYLGITIYFLPETLRVARRHFGFSLDLAKQLFNFGFPLIFTMSGMLIINSFDRYFLLHFHNLEEVGFYSLAVRVAAILGVFVIAPFQLAWAPFLFGTEDRDVTQISSKFFTYLIAAIALGGVVFLLFSREIILILSGSEYLMSKNIIPFTLISISLMGIYYWAGGLVNLKEQTWKLGAIVTLAGLSNLGLNILITPSLGWVGAATSDVLARAIAAGLAFWLAMRYYPVKIELSRLLRLMLILFGVCVSYYGVLINLDGPMAIVLKLMGISLGLLVLIVPLRFVTENERQAIKNLYLDWKSKYLRWVS